MSCGCDNINGNFVISLAAAGGSNVEVRGLDPIVVTKVVEGSKDVYYVSYQPYALPVNTFSVNQNNIEVGQVVNAVFTGTYAKGSKDITAKTVSPTVAGLVIATTPFTFTVNGLSSTSIAVIGSHTFSVSDGVNTVIKSAGIQVLGRAYTGFSASAAITDVTGFASGLGKNIKEVFGGARNYVVPAAGNYIYWVLHPSDTWDGKLKMNNFDFPAIKLANINVTNAYGLVVSCQVWRSFYAYGAGTLTIDM